ncbi:MAG: histone deacetylase [Myxococcales bacterium]|nr:histone deacetylase [Myxococcales bacterium]MCB9732907.1 histone deacetylase [Deltaproteobacteria bacterium]
MLEHVNGPGHPERPERLAAVLANLEGHPVAGTRMQAPRLATRDELTRVHAGGYVEALTRARGRSVRLDPDTSMSPGSYDAALHAAGAAITAVTAVVAGEARNAFALVRPPGHHAESSRAMGFCLFNNVAVAIAHAREALGVERVMHIDWDVHHGNGTQSAFYARRDVLVVDTHRSPFYPGTGALNEVGRDEGEGYTLNVPMPPGLGDADYAHALRTLAEPVAEAFRPQLVMVSAGFDAHRDDPIGDQRVSHEGFAELCGIAKGIAEAYAGGRLVLCLEGGYDIVGLTQSVRACVEVLAGSTPPEAHEPTRAGLACSLDANRVAQRYWRHIA